jgi:hypothetical protein
MLFLQNHSALYAYAHLPGLTGVMVSFEHSHRSKVYRIPAVQKFLAVDGNDARASH